MPCSSYSPAVPYVGGNQPEVFGELVAQTQALAAQARGNHLDAAAQMGANEARRNRAMKYGEWPTTPPWWCSTPAPVAGAANSTQQPSGLLDWEALSELQQQLVDHPRAIINPPGR